MERIEVEKNTIRLAKIALLNIMRYRVINELSAASISREVEKSVDWLSKRERLIVQPKIGDMLYLGMNVLEISPDQLFDAVWIDAEYKGDLDKALADMRAKAYAFSKTRKSRTVWDR